jgi:pyruvate formate lyase activating enzyme
LENGESGIVFNIQRYQIHDGPGIRTLVLLKGCPLRCQWCSNPEGQQHDPQLYYVRARCRLCGACVALCPQKASAIVDGELIINRKICASCGECVEQCLYSAREFRGKTMTTDEVVKEVEKDRSFYFISGGGITIGGGEPLAQAAFTKNILKQCKSIGIHTAIETSGCGQWSDLQEMIPLLDWIFYDLKTVDNARHIEGTRLSNERILDNATLLSKAIENQNTHLTVRVPVIPGFNNSQASIVALAEFVREHMKATNEIELLKYHSLALGKYDQLGMEYPLVDTVPSFEDEMVALKESIERCGVSCSYDGEGAEIYVGVK